MGSNHHVIWYSDHNSIIINEKIIVEKREKLVNNLIILF